MQIWTGATNNLGILLNFGDRTVMFFTFIYHADRVTAHAAKPTPFLKNQANDYSIVWKRSLISLRL